MLPRIRLKLRRSRNNSRKIPRLLAVLVDSVADSVSAARATVATQISSASASHVAIEAAELTLRRGRAVLSTAVTAWQVDMILEARAIEEGRQELDLLLRETKSKSKQVVALEVSLVRIYLNRICCPFWT